MLKVKDIYEMIKEYAPEELAEKWDNVGLLLGDENAEVTGILLSLDMDIEAVDMAVKKGANLIITHHPVIFSPLKNVNCKNPTSKVLYYAISHGINSISAHTNLDAANLGVSQILAERIGLINITEVKNCNVMRVGELPEAVNMDNFLESVKDKLNISIVNTTKYHIETVKKVAVVSGSGGSLIEEAKATDCDVYFLGEIKHEDAVYANILNLCVVAGGHHQTEVIILDNIKSYLQNKLNGVKLNLDVFDNAPTKCV